MASELVLLNFWASPYSMRVRIALAAKEIEYECKDEVNLSNKSPILLQMNPVHKKVPVLVHDGKPVCESLIIVEYIDEVWNEKCPLLPSDPYLKSQAKFWADFVDKKVAENGVKIWTTVGEEHEAGKKGFMEALKVLEGELGDKPYFGGESLGFVDVALVPFYVWSYTYESCGNFSIEDECPKLISWGKRCLEMEVVSKSVPDPKKVYDIVCEIRKMSGLE